MATEENKVLAEDKVRDLEEDSVTAEPKILNMKEA
jgi:hypothetical protein